MIENTIANNITIENKLNISVIEAACLLDIIFSPYFYNLIYT